MIFADDILSMDLKTLVARFGEAVVANAARSALQTELKKFLHAETRTGKYNDPVSRENALMELAKNWQPEPPKNKAATKIAAMISTMTAEQRAEVLESLKKLGAAG